MRAVSEGREGWPARLRAAIAETLRLVEVHPSAARFMALSSFAAGDRPRLRLLAARLLVEQRAAGERDASVSPPEGIERWMLTTVFDSIYRRLLAGTEAGLSEEPPQLMFLILAPWLGAEAALAELREDSP